MSQNDLVLSHCVQCAFLVLLHAMMPKIWRLRSRFRRHLNPNYVGKSTIRSPKALTFTPLFLFVSSLLLLLSNHILICCTLFSCPLLSVARNLLSIFFIHPSLHSSIQPFVHHSYSSVCSWFVSFVHSGIHPFIHSFTRSFLHSFINSFLSSLLPPSLPSFLPSFLPSLLLSFLPSFLPSFVFQLIWYCVKKHSLINHDIVVLEIW